MQLIHIGNAVYACDQVDAEALLTVFDRVKRQADEIERLRALLIHYGDLCGCDEVEMRTVCKLSGDY